jgi:hypothetical protein
MNHGGASTGARRRNPFPSVDDGEDDDDDEKQTGAMVMVMEGRELENSRFFLRIIRLPCPVNPAVLNPFRHCSSPSSVCQMVYSLKSLAKGIKTKRKKDRFSGFLFRVSEDAAVGFIGSLHKDHGFRFSSISQSVASSPFLFFFFFGFCFCFIFFM